MICGVLPPSICGVGDYTGNILKSKHASEWSVLSNQNWSIFNLFSLFSLVNKSKADVVFIQYPSEGYGWSLSPHMIVLYLKYLKRKKVVTVLHEYSSFKPKGRFFIDKILSMSSGLVFTTDFEAGSFLKKNPQCKIKTSVIPILANIPAPLDVLEIADRDIDVSYFGHIRPNKGLEDFLRVTTEIESRQIGVNVRIIGQIPLGYESYINELEEIFPGCKDKISLNLPDVEVANFLNRTKICYLPFPDGVSERRGSFLAATQAGCVVASYSGPWMTERLRGSFVELIRNNETDKLLNLILNARDLDFYHGKSLLYNSYSRIKTWDDVASEYIKIGSMVK